MTSIVLVHGISQEYESADQLEAEWLPAITGGLRIAGFPHIADAILSKKIKARMAFYGHRFRAQTQGAESDLGAILNRPLKEDLALEWLRRTEDSPIAKTRRLAALELRALLQPNEARQGVGCTVGSAIDALVRVPVLAHLGMVFAQTFVFRALSQVSAYFENSELRTLIRQDVLGLIDNSTAAIIGHSLGSVVAFEVAHLIAAKLNLLVTVGSPIGLRNVVYDLLEPRPPTFPPSVLRWTNFADQEDFVAAVRDLGPLFSTSQVQFCNYLVHNGASPHDPKRYLNYPALGRELARVL